MIRNEDIKLNSENLTLVKKYYIALYMGPEVD